MKAIFILGVDQQDRPERWSSKHHIYSNLSKSLEIMGIATHLYADRRSVKKEFLDLKKTTFSDEKSLEQVLDQSGFTHGFIWGGRTPADRSIVTRLRERDIRCVFAEAGWFPQSGHCYFSQHGTNAECRLGLEGLYEHQFETTQFTQARKKINRNILGFWNARKVPPLQGCIRLNTNKPILLPLQDEGDTNITLSSPVKTMHNFVTCIANRYPDIQFIARPHPRSPAKNLPSLSNVQYQDPATNPFEIWNTYGGVIGINSTTLLQFSLIGVAVCGIGTGIGTGLHAYHDMDLSALPDNLDSISINTAKSSHFFDFLIRRKQLSAANLGKPNYVKTTYIPQYFD